MNLPDQFEDQEIENISGQFFDQDIFLENMEVRYPTQPPSQETNRVAFPQEPLYNNSQPEGPPYNNSQQSTVSNGHIDNILDEMERGQGLDDLERFAGLLQTNNERWPSDDENSQPRPYSQPTRDTQPLPASQPNAIVPCADSPAHLALSPAEPVSLVSLRKLASNVKKNNS